MNSPRTAVITGGSGGIGAAACLALHDAGYRIVVHANRNTERAEAIANSIRASGGDAITVPARIADEAGVQELFAKAAAFGDGHLEVLVNCAGIYPTHAFADVTPAIWDETIATNVRGPFLCVRAALPLLRAAGHARIVNVGSGTVDLVPPMLTHYITSKAATIGFTRALARELGPDGITVNCLVPSLVDTETAARTFADVFDFVVQEQVIARRQQPEDLAAVLRFLCSPESAWITGQTLRADGGLVMR
jgi:3-oxoacyl-[acyl-carrier protein] reductase